MKHTLVQLLQLAAFGDGRSYMYTRAQLLADPAPLHVEQAKTISENNELRRELIAALEELETKQ